MRESPEKYYSIVKTEGLEDERQNNAITIYHLNNGMKREEALLAISMAVLEVKEWFNVKGNLTNKQVMMISEMILDYPQFYDLSLGNIKACFREKMMTEKLYDRLDGNIIIGWLRKFKSDMGDVCYRQRLEEDHKERLKEEGEWKGLDGIIDKDGKLKDEEAPKRRLDLLSQIPNYKRSKTKEEEDRFREGFIRYKAEYLLKKKNGEKIL